MTTVINECSSGCVEKVVLAWVDRSIITVYYSLSNTFLRHKHMPPTDMHQNKWSTGATCKDDHRRPSRKVTTEAYQQRDNVKGRQRWHFIQQVVVSGSTYLLSFDAAMTILDKCEKAVCDSVSRTWSTGLIWDRHPSKPNHRTIANQKCM